MYKQECEDDDGTSIDKMSLDFCRMSKIIWYDRAKENVSIGR
jgi:hypothetical protein